VRKITRAAEVLLFPASGYRPVRKPERRVQMYIGGGVLLLILIILLIILLL
jgi:hypothetical protein